MRKLTTAEDQAVSKLANLIVAKLNKHNSLVISKALATATAIWITHNEGVSRSQRPEIRRNLLQMYNKDLESIVAIMSIYADDIIDNPTS